METVATGLQYCGSGNFGQTIFNIILVSVNIRIMLLRNMSINVQHIVGSNFFAISL